MSLQRVKWEWERDRVGMCSVVATWWWSKQSKKERKSALKNHH